MNHQRLFPVIFLLCALLVLAACGGGDDGGDAVPADDGGLTYTGAETQAQVNTANADALATGALQNGFQGVGFSIDRDRNASNLVLAEYMADGIREAVAEVPDQAFGVSGLTLEKTIFGECGGQATYRIEVNALEDTFQGTLTFDHFCNNQVIMNGGAEFSGQYDDQTQTFGRIVFVFQNTTTVYDAVTRTIEGQWAYVRTGQTKTLTMNYLVHNSVTGNVRKVEDFQLTVTEGINQSTFSLAGRYYHPLYGYVTVSTPTTFATQSGAAHPDAGQLKVEGQGGAWATLTAVDADNYRIQADVDGDGNVDYDSGLQPW